MFCIILLAKEEFLSKGLNAALWIRIGPELDPDSKLTDQDVNQ